MNSQPSPKTIAEELAEILEDPWARSYGGFKRSIGDRLEEFIAQGLGSSDPADRKAVAHVIRVALDLAVHNDWQIEHDRTV